MGRASIETVDERYEGVWDSGGGDDGLWVRRGWAEEFGDR